MKRTNILLAVVFLVFVSCVSFATGTYYDCTRLLQEYQVIYCPNYPEPGKSCSDYWWDIYEERWGCMSVEYESSCTNGILPRVWTGSCTESPYNPFGGICWAAGDYEVHYMRACA